MSTAKRAVKKEPESEIVKVRMQGTEGGIDAFHKILQFAEDNGLCELQNFSDLFANKGTNKYFRAYSDVSSTEQYSGPLTLIDQRDTFCTRLCENESNLKVIQEIMGHSDISTTMDICAEATQEKKKEIMTNLEGKIIIR